MIVEATRLGSFQMITFSFVDTRNGNMVFILSPWTGMFMYMLACSSVYVTPTISIDTIEHVAVGNRILRDGHALWPNS